MQRGSCLGFGRRFTSYAVLSFLQRHLTLFIPINVFSDSLQYNALESIRSSLLMIQFHFCQSTQMTTLKQKKLLRAEIYSKSRSTNQSQFIISTSLNLFFHYHFLPPFSNELLLQCSLILLIYNISSRL